VREPSAFAGPAAGFPDGPSSRIPGTASLMRVLMICQILPDVAASRCLTSSSGNQVKVLMVPAPGIRLPGGPLPGFLAPGPSS